MVQGYEAGYEAPGVCLLLPTDSSDLPPPTSPGISRKREIRHSEEESHFLSFRRAIRHWHYYCAPVDQFKVQPTKPVQYVRTGSRKRYITNWAVYGMCNFSYSQRARTPFPSVQYSSYAGEKDKRLMPACVLRTSVHLPHATGHTLQNSTVQHST